MQCTPIGLRRRSSKQAPLTIQDKIRIAHLALVDFETQKAIAQEYRVSQQVVNHVVRNASKNRGYFEGLISKDSDKKSRRAKVADFVR